jgi:hypothetical protein
MDHFEERLLKTEIQLSRLVSDVDSEKRTRANVNANLELRLRELEKSNWKSTGALAIFMVILQVMVTLAAKLIH